MAEQGRTVRVSGLPADIEENRLKDKLLIHFLRRRNGGGEVESVTIVESTPDCALITFEESGVAQRVIQHGRHILEVDGKRHKVIVTEHQESPDPDQVILSLSAAVDYRQLPGGMSALKGLHKSHPDIQINQTAEDVCTLQGAYSKVQAALAQLLGRPGGLQCAETDSLSQPAIGGSSSAQVVNKPDAQESDQRRKANKQSQQREKDHSSSLTDGHRSGSYRHLTPGGFGWEDTGQSEGAASQPPEHPAAPEEDFSLIVDADMFQYLQRHCLKEYQKILSQYSVDVVDVTNQGLTTLFLKAAAEVGEDGRDVERMKLAKKSISRLYQENEAKIRRDQLPKNILTPRGGLQRAMENLSVRLPKLLLNEDDKNVYIIGSGSDVSEAKQFLLLDRAEEKEDLASLLRYPPNDSGTASSADRRESTLTSSSILDVDPGDDPMNQPLRSEEDERREEGARRYKLAARFKDSGLAALSNRPTDFSLRGLSSPRKQAQIGPMLGRDVLSETADIPAEALAQNTGGDILFRSGNSVRNKTPSNSYLTDTRPKSNSLISPLSPALSTLPGSPPRPPDGSGSSLKRASSFSGTPQQKAQILGQKSQDDSVKMRARSSSFTNQTRHKHEGYTAEITAPSVMWKHIKAAYSTRVDDLTSDVQIKESSRSGSDLTVTIRGATPSKVGACQQGLQRLVESVSVDFSVQELQLSELGITDRDDENLQACCAEVRSQYKKVTIMVLKRSLFLCGPKKLCFQIAAVLREVFSGVLAPNPEQHDFSIPSESSFLQTKEDHGAGVQSYGDSHVMLESQTSPSEGTGRRKKHGESELMNGSVSLSLGKKNPVIKEKVKVVAPGSNGVIGISEGFTNLQKEKTQTGVQDAPESPEGGPGCMCVCGATDKLTRTKCGASFCSRCVDTVHAQCRVCHEAELTPRGIWGKMKSSRVPIKIPGQREDSAVKITYIIPDGIQGEGHPCPGKPFKGGIFEAFFPDCDETGRLLPRLENAFRKGLTFTVMKRETGAKVIWDGIPHKTTVQGGKSGSGYPDSTYLTRLSKVLTSHGIEDLAAKSE